jgi:nucleotide-binding universal stress UspA family protein
MKTIAVLTDFSERSAHAAKYALLMAQKIKANVLLYNAFQVPDLVGIGRHHANHDYSEFKNKSKSNLRALSQELRDYFKESGHHSSFTPMIDFQCEEGVVANAVAELEENEDIVLLVIGTHGTDNEQAFLMGNNCLQIIDAANTPLLIVPENIPLKPMNRWFSIKTKILLC